MSNTYTTYDTVGIKEDVSDVISNLTPTRTPFQTMIGSEKTKNRKFEWLEDELAAVRDNAQTEGFEATEATLTPPSMRENYVQILEKTIKVSATEDTIDQYGRAKETAYQLVKAGQEVKRDFEHTLVGLNQAASAGAKDVSPRRTASAYQMIDASVTVTADGGAGAPGPLIEDDLLSAGQKAYNEGADPTIFMINPNHALKVAAFANAAGRTREFGQEKKVTNAVDIYVSPFGTYKVVLNRFQRVADALLLDPEMWSVVTLRDWTREPLAKTGDSAKHLLVGEKGLKHKNFRASGRIGNLA